MKNFNIKYLYLITALINIAIGIKNIGADGQYNGLAFIAIASVFLALYAGDEKEK